MEVAIQRGEYCGEPYEYMGAFSSYKKAVEYLTEDAKIWHKCEDIGRWTECQTMMKECSGGTEENKVMAKSVVIYSTITDYVCREYTILRKPLR